MNPWAAMGLVGAAFAALFGGFCWLRRGGRVHPELSRKGMHVGMGMITLTFPWLFSETWPVLLLGALLALLLASVRCFEPLRARMGTVLNDVNRSSWGEIYFILGVCLVFTLSAQPRVFYVVPLLILTVADAAAAVAGVFFGRTSYTVSDGLKTWEGTTLFFVLALLGSALPLGWSGAMSWELAALSGLCIGLLSTMIEAGSWRGLDNLLLPLSVLAMLRIYATESPEGLWLRLIMLGLLAVSFVPLRRHVLLHEGSLLGGLVLVYLCWAFGGWPWVIGPLTLLSLHPLFLRANPTEAARTRHAHPALLSIGLPALGWLMLARSAEHPPWLLPFSLTIAVQFAMTGLALTRPRQSALPAVRPLFLGVLSWLVVMGPAWALSQDTAGRDLAFLFALPAILAAVYVFRQLLPSLEADRSPASYWGWRAALASATSFTVAWL